MTTCDDGTQLAHARQVTSFVQIDSSILYSGLDSDAFHLYAILADKSWKLGCCWPSDREIGAWMGGISRRTVSRIILKLEAAGLIARTDVPVTEENPSGRLITVNGRVRPRDKSGSGGKTKLSQPPKTRLSHSSNTIREKKYGPPAPGTGAAREQTIEERIAEAREAVAALSTGPLSRWPHLRERAAAELAALEAQCSATAAG